MMESNYSHILYLTQLILIHFKLTRPKGFSDTVPF